MLEVKALTRQILDGATIKMDARTARTLMLDLKDACDALELINLSYAADRLRSLAELISAELEPA